MTNTHKNIFYVLGLLLFLTSCSRQKGPERLLPPEPVLIKGDIVKKPKPSTEEATLPLPAPQTEAEAQQPLPAWAQTQGEGVYKLGKPYKVNGVWYFPAENPRYDEIGFAGRYPKSFQGQRTANGEIYNHDRLTACHKTLPLPSIVQVTNLANNKSIIVRINDRGPFVNDRLIDISEKAANLLELPENEPAKVRIEIMKEESKTATTALNETSKAVLPAAAYPPMIAKEESSTDNKNETFVNVSPISAPATVAQDSLFDTTPEEAPVQNMAPAVAGNENNMAPVEQVSTPVKTYHVQAGIFSNPDNAQKLSDKLSAVGNVETAPVTINGRDFHRVRVGPFSSMADAERALRQTKAQNVPDARISVS